MSEQNRVLVRLAKSAAAAAGDLQTALRELAEAAATILHVDRASLWLYDEARSHIECIELYESGADRHSRGATLSAADYPAYFRALEEERAIVAHDAHSDPRTREFSSSYLGPLGIVAMLDAPIRLRGRMMGVVCHEHVGESRRWTLEEQSFAASIADLAALALEARERRRTEERLREQAQILDFAYDAILVRDLEGRVLSWNRGAEELYGWTAAEAAGQIVHVLLQTRFPKPRRQVEMLLLRTGRWEGELAGTRRDGRGVTVASRWALLRNERGDAAAVLEIGRDITDRKLREEALRESDERFRQLAENIEVVFYITQGASEQGAGKLLYVSPAYERVWGAPPETLYEQPRAWLDAVHPDDRPRVDEALRHVARGDFDEEFRIVHPGGEVRWVRSRSFPVRDAAGNVYRNAGIAEDITARRNTEEALRQAKEEAEVANRAKDQFLAALSHELRTPLTPVLALVSSLQSDASLPEPARQALATVRRNVELEARLIDDLLDLTRIARGKLELRREVIDVRQVLDHALEICRPEAAATEIRIDLAAGEHRAWADAPRLTQVFLNLLGNAVKFTPKKGGEVRVRTWNDGPRELVVEIADNGIGIEPDLLPHVFQAFQQGDRYRSRRFGGLGLGLAISRAIVEMHGGTLAAASAGRDRGANFTVRLPMHTAAAAGGGESASLQEPSRKFATEHAQLHLLLVEDHADTAEAMAELLRAGGHEVTVASSVAEGLAAAERGAGDFDLVISDLGLPDGSGVDLMRELSARYSLPGIALSGYGMEEDVRRSRDAGFARHLTKPVSLQALVTAIRETIESEP